MDGKRIRCLQTVSLHVPLSITVSEIQRDIREKIGNFSYTLVFDAPVFPSEYRHSLWYTGKLESCRYPMVKKFEDIFIRFGATHERVGRTDGQTPGDSIPRLCIMHRAVKIAVFTYRSPHFCFSWRRPCDYHAICCMNGKMER